MVLLSRFDVNRLLDESSFNFSRSGGKGGQNVNKVETKVELIFNVPGSNLLDEEFKERLKKKLENRLDSEGNLHIVAQSERTQLANRKKAAEKFCKLIQKALIKDKKRIRTKKPKAVKEKILEEKKKLSEKKRERKKINFTE
jgi:ribosome-associated protein